jgi:hypothetical protein
MSGLGLMLLLILSLVFYVWFAAALMSIARKTGTPGAALAWVPIGNAVLMCRIAGKSGWLVLLFLIPLVNLIVAVVLWSAIAQKRGKPAWAGVLILVPLVNLLIVSWIAAGDVGATWQPTAAAPASPAMPAAAATVRICGKCGTPAEPNEGFCGECGAEIVSAPAAPRAAGASPAVVQTAPKKSVLPLVAGIVALLLAGGGGWFAWSKLGARTQPRKQPALPTRMAGVMKEFPVDSNQQDAARPTTVVSQNLKHGASLNVPAKSLPPGLTAESMHKADSITSAIYHRTPKDPPVNVHVLDAPGATGEVGRNVASAVRAGAGADASVTGVQVQNPSGGTYSGWQIRSPQTSSWVLQDLPGQMVVVIYAPDPSVRDVAARLVSDIGNGAGLDDYPELQNTLWTLPAEPPGGFTLSEMNTFDTSDLISPDALKSTVGLGSADAADWQKAQQYLPQRITTATYLDGARAPWHVAVGDFGGAMKAWSTWTLLRWTAGLTGMKSVSAGGGDALSLQQNDGSYMLLRNGPYIAVLSGPPRAAPEQLTQLGQSLQIH